MLKAHRCRVCGETYLGDEAPSHCPYCGAPKSFLVDAKDYKESDDFEMSEVTRKFLEETLQLEIDNAQFYFCAMKKAGNAGDYGIFSRLAKEEAEHASVAAKMLKMSGPEISRVMEECFVTNEENYKDSERRETRAIGKYREAVQQVTEERPKMVFGALVLIETTHLELAKGHQ